MTKPAHGISEGALTDVDGWKIGCLPDTVLIDLTLVTIIIAR
ncbi:MAG TPA: hypothetical protein VFQ43_11450 [Nitrososphaera sp.]|nr:hypothetical protein [Nitrososphaera sp.]